MFPRRLRQTPSSQISSKSVVVELAPASDGRGLMRSTVMKPLRPPFARAANASAALWLAAASLAAAACGGSHCSFHALFWTLAATQWATGGDADTAAPSYGMLEHDPEQDSAPKGLPHGDCGFKGLAGHGDL